MRYINVFGLLLFLAVFMQACGGGGGAAVTSASTPVSSLNVSWDYYGAAYLNDYNIAGVKVYVGDTKVCATEDVNVLSNKTMNCDVSAFDLSTPLSFTLTAYDTDGYESPKSVVFTIS